MHRARARNYGLKTSNSSHATPRQGSARWAVTTRMAAQNASASQATTASSGRIMTAASCTGAGASRSAYRVTSPRPSCRSAATAPVVRVRGRGSESRPLRRPRPSRLTAGSVHRSASMESSSAVLRASRLAAGFGARAAQIGASGRYPFGPTRLAPPSLPSRYDAIARQPSTTVRWTPRPSAYCEGPTIRPESLRLGDRPGGLRAASDASLARVVQVDGGGPRRRHGCPRDRPSPQRSMSR